MGGVTIAHQLATTTESFPENEPLAIDQEQLEQFLAESAKYEPVEDLTGEVEELMMRESVNSWLQQPWTEENGSCLLNTQMYAESMQLEELFGQNYQDLSFEESPSSSDSSAQTSPVVEKSLEDIQFQTEPTTIVDQLPKRKRSLDSSDESSDESSEEEEDDDEESDAESVVIPTTVANMNSRVVYSSDDSDSESEMISSRATCPNYMYMPKRQIEETLLDRITNQLQPEKLPGILPILSSDNNQQEDEIEIDLSCLAREQLVQVLMYVDACLLEQQGGPLVNVQDFMKKKKGPRTRPARRPPMPKKTKTRAELTEDIDADSSSDEEEDDEPRRTTKQKASTTGGPISMASLSKKKRTRKSRKVKKNDDATLVSSVTVVQDPNSIASSRPKRRSALHKRRLLEEMLAPSDEEEEEEEDQDTQIIVFGDEKMDFGIMGNETIVHQADAPVIEAAVTAPVIQEADDATDEEIDIMF